MTAPDPMDSHRCTPTLRIHSAEGRDIWFGTLTERIPGHEVEEWCFHIRTPYKSVVFGLNEGDVTAWCAALNRLHVRKHGVPINANWMARTAEAQERGGQVRTPLANRHAAKAGRGYVEANERTLTEAARREIDQNMLTYRAIQELHRAFVVSDNRRDEADRELRKVLAEARREIDRNMETYRAIGEVGLITDHRFGRSAVSTSADPPCSICGEHRNRHAHE